MSEPAASIRIIYTACPLCGSADIAEYKKADPRGHKLYHPILGTSMIWNRCDACMHIFTEGYFTPEAEQAIFSKTHDNQTVAHDIEQQRYVSARMVDRVTPFVNSGHWLDVGFGNASLLFTAHEYGFIPVGTDLRQANIKALQDWGIEAHCKTLDQLDHTGRYSVISMADVLEHIPFPGEGLKHVHRLLNDQGVVLISMPNIDSIMWQHMDKIKLNPYWREIEHYHNFGRTRLYALLQECGFEPVRYGVSERYRACMEIIARKKV
jgi:hypothetical protein